MEKDLLNNVLKKCTLCPRNCKVNRYKTFGYCGAGSKIKLALASIHNYEEPFISGNKGSGTIFFSNCNLGCIFCQNKKIKEGYGKEISLNRFSEILLEQQYRQVHNINLVTPTHFVPLIREGIIMARKKGLSIPIVYNTSSYENISTIKMMDNLVDIYLADLKYFSNELGIKYSNCKDYFKYATKAIEEMYKQVGSPVIEDNLLKKGLVVRVLVLPGEVDDAKKIIKYLYDTYKDNIYISIMNQYTPITFLNYSNLNRKLRIDEYTDIVNYAVDLGIKNAFIQEEGTCKESFIPDFDLSNL